MSGSCELHALLVSADPAILESLSACLDGLGITPAVCSPSSAIELLVKSKADLIFVDQDLDAEFSVIQHARLSPSSKSAVSFAIVPHSQGRAVGFCGADFVIDKPIRRESLERSLQAAYGIMLKERRRYTRYALKCEAMLQDSTAEWFPAATSNISQTGLALECAAPFIHGEVIRVQFSFPHNPETSKFKAQVIWTANGRAGLVFTQMAARTRERLTEWIDGEFLREWHPYIPESIAGRFVRVAR